MYLHPLMVSAIPPGQAHPLCRDCSCPLGKPKAKGEVQIGNWPLSSKGDLQKAQTHLSGLGWGGGQYLMLALMPQALRGEVVNSQCAVKIAHSSQWHPTDMGRGITWDMGKQGCKHIQVSGKRQTLC